MDEARAVELGQDAEHAAGAVHVLDVVLAGRGRDLAQARHPARDAVDVRHGELHVGLARAGQEVQHGVGRAAHGHVERHGVLESLEGRDRARQDRGVVLARSSAWHSSTARRPARRKSSLRVACVATRVPLPGRDRPSASVRQFIELAVNMPEHDPQVGQAERSYSATSASDTAGSAGLHDGVDEIRMDDLAVLQLDLAGFHRAAGHEHRRDVEAQRRHQHAGRDLVAVRDAHHGVGAMGVDHVLDAVGDELARGQRVEHAVVPHGDAVVDGDGVEFLGDAAGRLDLARDHLPQVLQVHVAGHELGEAVDHGDDGLAEVALFHSGGPPQGAGASHVATEGGGARAVVGHADVSYHGGRCDQGTGPARVPRWCSRR